MSKTIRMFTAASLLALGSSAVFAQGGGQQGPPPPMSFFITSVGPGKGADLGGLAGADKHCQTLAAAVGAGNRTWHAYLSTQAVGGQPAVNARDRIGAGPWHNAKGVLIANNVADLHGDNERDRNNIQIENSLTEKGGHVKGRGEMPNEHDILTGSDSQGRAFRMSADTTCGNWTKSGAEGSANVGHHDRSGLSEHLAAKSWNHSHGSRGCSQDALRSSGGNGLFYCFAAK